MAFWGYLKIEKRILNPQILVQICQGVCVLFDLFYYLYWYLLNWKPIVTMVILVVFSEIGSVFPVEYDFAGLPLTIKGLFLMFYT